MSFTENLTWQVIMTLVFANLIIFEGIFSHELTTLIRQQLNWLTCSILRLVLIVNRLCTPTKSHTFNSSHIACIHYNVLKSLFIVVQLIPNCIVIIACSIATLNI